jgi:hypothetical protein
MNKLNCFEKNHPSGFLVYTAGIGVDFLNKKNQAVGLELKLGTRAASQVVNGGSMTRSYWLMLPRIVWIIGS